MSKLKQGVNYMAYAQKDPLTAYINEGYKMFQEMATNIALEITLHSLHFHELKIVSQGSKA